jgi:hypothetical protein
LIDELGACEPTEDRAAILQYLEESFGDEWARVADVSAEIRPPITLYRYDGSVDSWAGFMASATLIWTAVDFADDIALVHFYSDGDDDYPVGFATKEGLEQAVRYLVKLGENEYYYGPDED